MTRKPLTSQEQKTVCDALHARELACDKVLKAGGLSIEERDRLTSESHQARQIRVRMIGASLCIEYS